MASLRGCEEAGCGARVAAARAAAAARGCPARAPIQVALPRALGRKVGKGARALALAAVWQRLGVLVVHPPQAHDGRVGGEHGLCGEQRAQRLRGGHARVQPVVLFGKEDDIGGHVQVRHGLRRADKRGRPVCVAAEVAHGRERRRVGPVKLRQPAHVPRAQRRRLVGARRVDAEARRQARGNLDVQRRRQHGDGVVGEREKARRPPRVQRRQQRLWRVVRDDHQAQRHVLQRGQAARRVLGGRQARRHARRRHARARRVAVVRRAHGRGAAGGEHVGHGHARSHGCAVQPRLVRRRKAAVRVLRGPVRKAVGGRRRQRRRRQRRQQRRRGGGSGRQNRRRGQRRQRRQRRKRRQRRLDSCCQRRVAPQHRRRRSSCKRRSRRPIRAVKQRRIRQRQDRQRQQQQR